MTEDIITHRGVISAVERDSVFVSIIAQSACAACHAKGYCGVSDMQEKIVEVPLAETHEHKNGEFVVVTMKRSMGLSAVLYGYFIPFLVLLATLLTVYEVTGNEALAGLVSLGILVPYYTGLYLLRDRFTKKFRFEIEKDKSDTHINF